MSLVRFEPEFGNQEQQSRGRTPSERRANRLCITAAITAAMVTGISACGGTQPVKTVTVTNTTVARQLTTGAAPSHSRPTTARHKPRASMTTRCDAAIKVRRTTTTCAFAENVFYAYWLSQEEPGVFADSPGFP